MASDSHPFLPTVSEIPSLTADSQENVLALLFEPSSTLSERYVPLLASTPFETYSALINTIGADLRTLAARGEQGNLTALEDILSSHPRLGEKKVDSAMSRMEQAAMNAASKSTEDEEEEKRKQEESEILKGLNAEYETTFPGLRYVVFVNGRSRPVIFEDMKKRIARGDIAAERIEAIDAMCDIASDRAKKLEQQL